MGLEDRGSARKEGVQMPGILLRVDCRRLGRSRLHVDPADSVASLMRDVALRLGIEGEDSMVLLSKSRTGDGVFDNPSASISRAGLKNGDTVFAFVVASAEGLHRGVGAKAETEAEAAGQKQLESAGVEESKQEGERKLDEPKVREPDAAASASTSAVLHAALEATEDRQHCRKYLLDGRIVPSAPTLAGRIVQRANLLTSSQFTTGSNTGSSTMFTDRAPITAEQTQQYESWNDYVSARGGISKLSSFPKLVRTRLTRRGSNVLPDTITVKRQRFRHVDNVILSNDYEFRQFAASWLASRTQHIGFLFGSYDTPAHGPSSAHIEVIYEPPQERSLFGARLADIDHDLPMVRRVASLLGLEPIGWIFTHAPREESMTCTEILAAAQFQNENPVVASPGDGERVRSRFLTMTLSTNTSGAIVPKAFMVSDQACAFESDGLMEETKGWPEYMSIRAPGKGFVFPIVLADTQVMAGLPREMEPLRARRKHVGQSNKMPPQSFPADLLLVDLSVMATTARGKGGLFASRDKTFDAFPIENRSIRQTDVSATVGIVRSYLNRALARSPRPSLDSLLTDFHLLIMLPRVVGFDLTSRICKELVSRRPLTRHTRLLVEAFLK